MTKRERAAEVASIKREIKRIERAIRMAERRGLVASNPAVWQRLSELEEALRGLLGRRTGSNPKAYTQAVA